jgi:hypothetical protein
MKLRVKNALMTKDTALKLYERGETPKSLKERGCKNPIAQLSAWYAHITMGTYSGEKIVEVPMAFAVLCLEFGVPEEAFKNYLGWGKNRIAWAKSHKTRRTYENELLEYLK